MVKVSIVIPVYNVQNYLRQCLDSVVQQSLKDIEIICVNDGSTDDSLAILQEYAARDDRIVILDKKNTGYGNSMNCGFDMANGEYIGIIESDDYAEPDMFECLYSYAQRDKLDVIKSGFFLYYSKPEERNVPVPIASAAMCSRVFCPVTDFKSAFEQAEFFNIKPTIWSAIYRRDFIRENGIRFNETPGASYQDAGFNFKVWACAMRVRLIESCFLHYRQDNENSSINSPGKVYCICDEYAEMERFLKNHPMLKGKLEGVRTRIKYDSYIWNYERLSEPLQKEFILFASKDLESDMHEGLFDQKYFPYYKWDTLQLIIEDPEEFHRWKQAEKRHEKYEVACWAPKSFMDKLKAKYRGGVDCLKEHGWIYTIKNFMGKVKRKVFH